MILLGWAWALCAALLALLWLVERRTRDAGVADAGWCIALGLCAGLYAVLGPGWPPRRLLLSALAGAWSLRLAIHLLKDRILGKPEDARYRELRARWGESSGGKFFWLFQANALLAAVLSVPFLVVCSDPREGFGPREAAAGLLWAAALWGETSADRRLAAWRADPANKGRTCRAGWWRYSRHPNYFFEWLHWWAYVVLAAGAPGWGWTLLGPALMLVFLTKVTGIAATEAHALKSRSDYADYRRTTSAFIPWFPRSR